MVAMFGGENCRYNRYHSLSRQSSAMFRRKVEKKPSQNKRSGAIFVEYLLLLTIVGIGVIVGLVEVREALVNELKDLAAAINAIDC